MASGARSARASPTSRCFLSAFWIFISAILVLFFIAAICLFVSSNSESSDGNSGSIIGSNYFSRARSGSSYPDRFQPRFDLIQRQAADHVALINAYAAFALRAKIDASRVLKTFDDLVGCLTSLLSRIPPPENSAAVDDEALKALEKELKDRLKLARQLIAETKESFDTQIKIQKLRDTVFAVGEQLNRARKLGDESSKIAAGSTPKTLHCIAMRLMEEHIANPESYKEKSSSTDSDLVNPDFFHYAIFSDNVVAVSVVINSAVKSAAEPFKQVFHVITDKMHLAAFQVWFRLRPPGGGAKVEIRSDADFSFLNSETPLLDRLKFYLPDIFPKLDKIILLEDDVVVQRDLTGLWSVDLGGKVNGAVEKCFGPFQRFSRYLNVSHPAIKDKVSARACAWAFGVNVFDLDAWRREKCTDQYIRYEKLNGEGELWNPGETLPAGLLTFYGLTKALDKRWHVMGLGYNPSIAQDVIEGAAVVHFDGHMKPWLDIAMNQYKNLWMDHVHTNMEFLQLCNFGI